MSNTRAHQHEHPYTHCRASSNTHDPPSGCAHGQALAEGGTHLGAALHTAAATPSSTAAGAAAATSPAAPAAEAPATVAPTAAPAKASSAVTAAEAWERSWAACGVSVGKHSQQVGGPVSRRRWPPHAPRPRPPSRPPRPPGLKPGQRVRRGAGRVRAWAVVADCVGLGLPPPTQPFLRKLFLLPHAPRPPPPRPMGARMLPPGSEALCVEPRTGTGEQLTSTRCHVTHRSSPYAASPSAVDGSRCVECPPPPLAPSPPPPVIPSSSAASSSLRPLLESLRASGSWDVAPTRSMQSTASGAKPHSSLGGGHD